MLVGVSIGVGGTLLALDFVGNPSVGGACLATSGVVWVGLLLPLKVRAHDVVSLGT